MLDTWFSSWLWPFSTLGWPKKTPELDYFYPTSTLVTAQEIIFFWVARMIMAGCFCMKQPPFTDVYIHGTVRDITGKKMSKSLGNIIDPIDIIIQYGTDALRYTLVTATAIGQDVFLSEERFAAGRNFANKLWNATRFVLSQLEADRHDPKSRTSVDQWIESRLQHAIERVTDSLDKFLFNDAATTLYDFLWHDLCDWYLEISKIKGQTTTGVLVRVLETGLRLLHPVMPFVTEELWQQLPKGNRAPASIMTAPWPKADKKLRDVNTEEQFERFKEILTFIRVTRAENALPANRKIPTVWLVSKDQAILDFFREHKMLVETLANVGAVGILDKYHKQGDAITRIFDDIEVAIPQGGLIDVEKEFKRLQQEANEKSNYIERTEARLNDPQFTSKAPPAVVEQTRAQLSKAREALKNLRENLASLQSK